MIVAGRYAYVCLWGEGSIAKVDIGDLESDGVDSVRVMSTVTLGPDTFPYSLNIDPTRRLALVACNAIKNIPVIDLTTDELKADVPVRAGGVRAVTFTTDHKYALASLERDNSLAVIELDKLQVTRYIEAGPAPRGVATDFDGTVYASLFSRASVMKTEVNDWGSHSITVIPTAGVDLSDSSSEISVEAIPVGFGPCSVSVFDPAAARLELEAQERSMANA